MILLMKIQKWVLIVLSLILITDPAGACSNIPANPAATATTTPRPTPFLPSTAPATILSTIIAFTVTPDFCNVARSQDKIKVVSDNIFTALEPGNPVVFDRILTAHDPAWADFHQTVHGEARSAGVIFHETSAGPELGTALNPAAILVTYGVERNWELPASGDLVSEVEHIRAVLFQHRSDWIHGQIDQSQYPVANAASFALYRYFDDDLSKLEAWCRTYVEVYDEPPLK